MNRRDFIRIIQAGSAAAAFSLSCDKTTVNVHPRIYIRKTRKGGLRTVADLQNAIKTDTHSQKLAQKIIARADADIETPPLVPTSIFPGRSLTNAKYGNRDYSICNAVNKRILSSALANLLNPQESYKNTVLQQMESLFNPQEWTQWIDDAHLRFGHPADLRTGMLSQSVALAFDWLYPYLNSLEKNFILEGLDRCGIQPFLIAINQDPWWLHDLNNWLTVIVGGLGITGMAVKGDHPDADKLVKFSNPLMEKYEYLVSPNICTWLLTAG